MLYRKKRRLISIKFKVIFLLISALLFIVIKFFENQVSLFSVDYIQNKAKAVASEAVCNSVNTTLSKLNYDYDSLAELCVSQDGGVTAIKTNSSNINILKSTITTAAQNDLQKIKKGEIKIPLGAFTKLTYLSNMGPDVVLNYCFTGNVNSEIISTFESAGVNQTIHHIKLLVTSEIITASVDYEGSITFTTDFELAQTVIAGDIPAYYEDNYIR